MKTEKKIFFMHIAKAAGSSVNKIFGQILGEENCHFHAESILSEKSLKEILENKKFVSGHIYFNFVKELEDDDNIITFTLFREPYSHISSHILWLDHYGMPEYKQEYEGLNQDIKELIDFISDTDIANPYDLDYFLTNLPPWGIKMLNNCQTRYLLGQQNNFKPLSLKDFPYALKHLKSFNVCGTVENMKQTFKSVFELSGETALNLNNLNLETRTNKKVSKRQIDITNSLVRSVLQKHILVDIKVYNTVAHQ